jgi:ParB family chromosome partitioning protein
MQVSVQSIKVENRIRNDLGDLTPLMDSLRKHGQLNPVTISADSDLIAGHRRLESARRLGWLTVDAIRLKDVSEADRLEMEIDENVHRKELTPEEVQTGYDRLEKLRNPPMLKRIGAFFKGLWAKLFGRKKP